MNRDVLYLDLVIAGNSQDTRRANAPPFHMSWLSAVSEDARFNCCTELSSRDFIEASKLSLFFSTSSQISCVTYSVCCSAMSDGRERNGGHKIRSFVCGNWRRVASPRAIPTFIPNDRPILHRTISLWCPRAAKIYISVYFMLFIRQKMNNFRIVKFK